MNHKLDHLIESAVSFYPKPMEDDIAKLKQKLSKKFKLYEKGDIRSAFLIDSVFVKQYIQYAKMVLHNTLIDSQNYWSNKPKIEEALAKTKVEMSKFHPESNEYQHFFCFIAQFQSQLLFSQFMIVHNNERKGILEDLLVYLNSDSVDHKEKVKKIIETEDLLEKRYDELSEEMVKNR